MCDSPPLSHHFPAIHIPTSVSLFISFSYFFGSSLPSFLSLRYKELGLGPTACIGSINSEGLPNSGIDYYLTEKVRRF